ncbi:MAG: zinc-ribbon domain-containing protein [Clostridia bacterium]|nr:zinc-ribbon domain-containing protein [Clostridia bacterium]
MVCPNCGSTNVRSEQKQIINNNVKIKRGNGCLWWLLLGWLYILYIAVKWFFKILYFIFIGWWVALIKKNKKSEESRTVVHICQDCGHKWETVSAKNVSRPAPAAVTPIKQQNDEPKRIAEAPSRTAPAYGEAPRRTAPTYGEAPSRTAPTYGEAPRRTAPTYGEAPSRTAPTYGEAPSRTAPTYGEAPSRTAPASSSRTSSTSGLWNRPSSSGFDAPASRTPATPAEEPSPVRKPAKRVFCPGCGSEIDPSAMFCGKCGTRQ